MAQHPLPFTLDITSPLADEGIQIVLKIAIALIAPVVLKRVANGITLFLKGSTFDFWNEKRMG